MTSISTSSRALERRGLVLVISSPSGAGKTTLAQRLLAQDNNIKLSVSVTTRPARPGEVDGADYWFISEEEFRNRREAGELLEWAEVYGNFYGTPRAPVEAMMASGNDVLFDIDWQGAQQLGDQIGSEIVRVFVLPPSGPVLEQRLRQRAQDSDAVVTERMARAADEVSHWGEYDYVIVNEDLDVSAEALQSILIAERLRRERQVGLPDFVREILHSL